MAEIRVEVLAFWDFKSIRWSVVISCQNVVDVVDSTWSISNLREISRPNSSIGILGLILGDVVGIDVVMNIPGSLVPFLVVELFKVMVSWSDGKVLNHFLRL